MERNSIFGAKVRLKAGTKRKTYSSCSSVFSRRGQRWDLRLPVTFSLTRNNAKKFAIGINIRLGVFVKANHKLNFVSDESWAQINAWKSSEYWLNWQSLSRCDSVKMLTLLKKWLNLTSEEKLGDLTYFQAINIVNLSRRPNYVLNLCT